MFYFVDCPKSIFYYLFIVFSLGFKYILHIIAGLFAFSIRKVKVGALNDFRYVSTYVYVSSILITMYIAFVFIAGGRPTLFAGALIGILFLEISLLLCLVFIPKVCPVEQKVKFPLFFRWCIFIVILMVTTFLTKPKKQ